MPRVPWVPAGSGSSACCCSCPPHVDLPVVLVAPISCGVYQVSPGSGEWFIATITGVSGMFDATWVPGNFDWEVTVGSVSTQKYSDEGITPVGDPVVTDAILVISCDPATGLLSVQIGGIFISGGFIDVPLTNTFTCTDGNKPAHGGGVTVSSP